MARCDRAASGGRKRRGVCFCEGAAQAAAAAQRKEDEPDAPKKNKEEADSKKDSEADDRAEADARAAAKRPLRARSSASRDVARTRTLAKRQARAEVAAQAAAAQAAAAPSPTAGLTSKDAAKWRRAFAQAVLSPEAEACGLARMASDIKQQTSRKRAAWSALASQWHAFGFNCDRYAAKPSMPRKRQRAKQPRPSESRPNLNLVLPRCQMVGQCGGEKPFQQKIRAGRVEIVAGRASGKLGYRWSLSRHAGPAAAAKNATRSAASRDKRATARLTADQAERIRAALMEIDLDTAFHQIGVRNKLEYARQRCEIQISNAEQARQALTATAPLTPPQKTISYCLADAMRQPEEVAKRLAVERSVWNVAEIASAEWVTASKLLDAAELHLASLAEWAEAAADAASRSLAPRRPSA